MSSHRRLMTFVRRAMVIFATGLMSWSAHAGWQATFADNFDGTTLDMTKWRKSDYWGLHTNIPDQQLQCYVDDKVTVANGVLSLTASNQPPLGCNPDPGYLIYSSGQISSAFNFQQTYGYFEMRAKMPAGQGLWPTFNLAIPGGSFPPEPPEIGVGSIFGQSPSTAQLRYDAFDGDGQLVSQIGTFAGPNFTTGFHVFGVDWQPGLLIWYVDGVERYRYAGANVYANPMYMILQLSVGGNRSGNPDATTLFPTTMEVDYVRAYQRVNDGNPDSLPPGVTPADSVAPNVTITSPKCLSRIVQGGKTYSVTAKASDNIGVTSVEFYQDDVLVCTDTSAPYSCNMKSPTLGKKEALRNVTLRVRAKDAAGNIGSNELKILVVK